MSNEFIEPHPPPDDVLIALLNEGEEPTIEQYNEGIKALMEKAKDGTFTLVEGHCIEFLHIEDEEQGSDEEKAKAKNRNDQRRAASKHQIKAKLAELGMEEPMTPAGNTNPSEHHPAPAPSGEGLPGLARPAVEEHQDEEIRGNMGDGHDVASEDENNSSISASQRRSREWGPVDTFLQEHEEQLERIIANAQQDFVGTHRLGMVEAEFHQGMQEEADREMQREADQRVRQMQPWEDYERAQQMREEADRRAARHAARQMQPLEDYLRAEQMHEEADRRAEDYQRARQMQREADRRAARQMQPWEDYQRAQQMQREADQRVRDAALLTLLNHNREQFANQVAAVRRTFEQALLALNEEDEAEGDESSES